LIGYGFFTNYQAKINAKWGPYLKLCDDVNSNNINAVKSDLAHGVDPNKFPNDDEAVGDELDSAALCLAARNGNIAIANLLIDHRADPNIDDGWDGHPLTAAAATDDVTMLHLLVQRGAKINDSSNGSSALWRAAVSGNRKAEKWLLDHGANPNTTAYTTKPNMRILQATTELRQTATSAPLRKYGATE
jgi:ankyrin repeat protein